MRSCHRRTRSRPGAGHSGEGARGSRLLLRPEDDGAVGRLLRGLMGRRTRRKGAGMMRASILLPGAPKTHQRSGTLSVDEEGGIVEGRSKR